MKIWFPAIRSGSGSDVFTERLVMGLRKKGVDAVATWFPLRHELFPELMRRERQPEGVDIIHCNGWVSSVFLDRGVPVVTTIHHLVHDPAYAPYRSYLQSLYHNVHIRRRESLAIRQSSAVTAVSSYVARTVERFSGSTPQIISNWVNTARYVPTKVRGPRADGTFRLLMVGNLSRRKGMDLLPAFLEALGSGFELRCTAGLRGSSAGLSGIKALGTLDEASLLREYQECDAVVSLSRYEGFGYTALEAMACAKPFIGFRAGGLSDPVTHDVTGFLEDVEDVASLAHRCRYLALERERSIEMGEAGRARALSHFNEEAGVGAFKQLYESLLAQGGCSMRSDQEIQR